MRRDGNINFVLVGARATGKTAYLTALYSQINEVTANDSETIDYLKPFSDKLREGIYPSATAGGLKELFFNYKDDTFTASIQIDDVDGYFIETLSEQNEETEKERNNFMHNLKSSEGIIFFFPYQEEFNEETIKDFNYQIDFILAKLKSFYSKKDSIPIPSVIAISKWDNSPNFKAEDEIDKAVEFIGNNEFLRLAKKKIELNFSDVKIMPISAIGKDISSIEPYNLLHPLRFFLEKTYENWVSKIESLEDKKEEKFIFLSKINFDMKFYENGKYSKLYKELETEYSTKLISKAKESTDLQVFSTFKKQNEKVINALTSKNIEEIEKIENFLKKEKRGLNIRKFFIAMLLLAVIIFFSYKQIDNRKEDELYNDILTSYKLHKYNETINDIDTYFGKYKIKGVHSHIIKIKEIENNIQKDKIIGEAKKILEDTSFEDTDKIEIILNKFEKFGIKEAQLKEDLLSRKKSLIANGLYSDFEYSLKHSTFIESINQVEEDWNSKFSTDKIKSIITILDSKLNKEVQKKLKSISSIRNVDEFTNLKKRVKEIENYIKRNGIEKISYTPKLNSENEMELEKKREELQRYTRVLKGGVRNPIIVFKTLGGEENDNKLGFDCEGENEIILKINATIYHYDKQNNCTKESGKNMIVWKNVKNIIRANSSYDVKVIEEDIAEDDEYKSQFALTKNELIDIYNGYTVSKDIGHSYFVEITGQ